MSSFFFWYHEDLPVCPSDRCPCNYIKCIKSQMIAGRAPETWPALFSASACPLCGRTILIYFQIMFPIMIVFGTDFFPMIYIKGCRIFSDSISSYIHSDSSMILTHYSNLTMYNFYQVPLLLVCTYLVVRAMRTVLYTLRCRTRLSRIRGPTSSSWLKGNYFNLVSSTRKVK